MSCTTSTNSTSFTGVLASINQKLANRKSTTMEVHLENHYSSKAYTSSSTLSGHVVINPTKDTRFDSLEILLMGVSKTRMEGMHSAFVTNHTFLKLHMPISESSYPVPRVYKAGHSYTVPFHFVIPSYLTLSACNHQTRSDAVSGHHLCIPPSLGTWDKDEMTPDMVRVEYTVRARLYRHQEIGQTRAKIFEAAQVFNVLPAFAEQPPLNITPGDGLYTMTKTQSLRKSILSPKTGKVTLTAAQPGAVMLSPDGTNATTTSARIDLMYEASSSQSSSSALPKVTQVTSKLSAVTFFSSAAIADLPNLGNWAQTFGVEGRGYYAHVTSLGPTTVDDFEWKQQKQQHIMTAQARRDSGYCSDVAAADSDHSSGHSGGRRRWSIQNSSNSSPKTTATTESPVYHTATLQVPISLPAHKTTFVPTFHSCIASRVYVLWLTVTLSSGGGGGSTKTKKAMTVGVPLQIGVVGPDAAPTFEAAMEEEAAAQAEEHLRPRILRAPEVEFERHALPGYGDSVGWRTVTAGGT